MVKRSVVFALLLATGCVETHTSTYLAPETDRRQIKSAVVLPLENLTSSKDAGSVAADVFATELVSRRLSTVDREHAEAALRQLNLVPGATVDRIAARHIGEILKVDAVVFGSISELDDGAQPLGPPKRGVGVTVRVVDVKSGSYLLAGSYSASADSVLGATRRVAEEVGKQVGP